MASKRQYTLNKRERKAVVDFLSGTITAEKAGKVLDKTKSGSYYLAVGYVRQNAGVVDFTPLL